MAHHPLTVPPGFPPTDLVPVRTADGSYTLDSLGLKERYHSLHGALSESRHVYIAHGLLACSKQQLDVLEVGLGTGLNALLTWIESEIHGLQVEYHALEPYPLPVGLRSALDHPARIDRPGCRAAYETMMDAKPGSTVQPGDSFRFRVDRYEVQRLSAREAFDVVYFDAFAPSVQPAMWTADVFRCVYQAMRPGALLVTYCAQGEARRAMQAAGLQVERLPGPPGKRHMVRAQRPA